MIAHQKQKYKYYQIIRLLEIKFLYNIDIEEKIIEYLQPSKKYLVDLFSHYHSRYTSQNNKYKYNTWKLNLDNQEIKMCRCAICDGLISIRYIINKKLMNTAVTPSGCDEGGNLEYKKCKKVIQITKNKEFYKYHELICLA